MTGVLVFATAVAVIWTVLYVAYHRSGGTIHAATTADRPQRYDEVTETDSSFLAGDFPEQLTDFQRSVRDGFVQLPDFTQPSPTRRRP